MFIAFFHCFSIIRLEASLIMYICDVFRISLITESYKQNLFEQAQTDLLYCLEIATNKLAKSEDVNED